MGGRDKGGSGVGGIGDIGSSRTAWATHGETDREGDRNRERLRDRGRETQSRGESERGRE